MEKMSFTAVFPDGNTKKITCLKEITVKKLCNLLSQVTLKKVNLVAYAHGGIIPDYLQMYTLEGMMIDVVYL